MGSHQIVHIEIDCDFPGCDEWFGISNLGFGVGTKIEKMMFAIGWTSISFPGENKYEGECLYFCAKCRGKDPRLIKKHKCIYMRKTKKGKPSEYGSVLECYFCGRLK